MARYNTNGTLDDNFAADGTVTTDFFNGPDYAKAVAIQADGKIVAGGTAKERNGGTIISQWCDITRMEASIRPSVATAKSTPILE